MNLSCWRRDSIETMELLSVQSDSGLAILHKDLYINHIIDRDILLQTDISA
jgi:hypothetical protein